MKPVRTDDQVFSRLCMDNYDMEVKLDGFRLVLTVDNGVRMFTRQKNPIVIPENLIPQLSALGLPDGTILDGEIWNTDKRGAWQHNARSVCYVTFWDITRVGNLDVSNLPIEQRREKLRELVKPSKDIFTINPTIANFDSYLEIKKDAISHKARTHSKTGYVHGVVLKKKGSPRRDHVNRSIEHSDWLKICFL